MAQCEIEARNNMHTLSPHACKQVVWSRGQGAPNTSFVACHIVAHAKQVYLHDFKTWFEIWLIPVRHRSTAP